MPILTTPWLAGAIAGLLGRGPGPRIAPEIAFAQLPVLTADAVVPTRHGDVRATVYAPPGGLAGAPVYVNFHGGAFIMRHPEQDDPLCRYLAHECGVAVVNVDYDVAPRHPFPVPVEQGYDAVVWAAGADREWDGTRLVVGGQSAGGAIAAAVARQARDAGAPTIRLQVLQYPPLDLVTPGAQKKAAGRSIISVPMTQVADTVYVPADASKRDPRASPAWQGNLGPGALTGQAPAVVVSCANDRLRDEDVRYAEALDAEGLLVEHIALPGVDHGYNIMGAQRDVVEGAYRRIAAHVRRAVA
ncbi:alpha/beta hydrolase fold domain-containing protein [Microbacterium marinilacus]|uniref:Alpha/beta hydrolase n=1 Tax=Microbacterium marinilacus TaxID=415209 RepID=A0ABP7BEG8_9MICO|nr:alpha/beta hydrolase fold domain-containing protein [Microbacterium marinilacus]MBY0688998.1 alpha/beta hydrolase [Microbacterium marinilacus]